MSPPSGRSKAPTPIDEAAHPAPPVAGEMSWGQAHRHRNCGSGYVEVDLKRSPRSEHSRGERMQNGYRRVVLVGIVLLSAVGGVAGRALALTFKEFPVSTPMGIPSCLDNAAAITTGPDGALWFIEKPNKIARITTAGVITEFDLPERTQCTPPPCGFATSITTGPDGALWFGEYDFAEVGIGRITTDGVVTEFPFPPFSSIPQRITTGPDGALWFTEPGNTIGRITTAGVITRFPIPLGSGQLFGLTTGPDGGLWFTERASFAQPTAGRIGRITTAGVVTEFPADADPVDITAGPDGALWFTDPTANKIVRMTTAGSLTEFLLPSSAPTSITTGPDGAVRFTH